MSPTKKGIKRLKPVKPVKTTTTENNEENETTTEENKDQEKEKTTENKKRKTEIQKLNETLENRENASVAAIEKLTAIMIANMKVQENATAAISAATATAAAAAKAEVERKNEEEKTKNQEFQIYFQNDDQMETEQDENQVITIEEIKTTDKNLLKLTNDYTDQIKQIHNTNIKDPNIPHNDAIQARNNSIKEINTIKMLVKTINNMKQQIKNLTEETTTIKKSNQNLQTEVNQIKETINNKILNTNKTKQDKPQTTEDNPIKEDNNDFQIQRTRNNRNKTKIEVTQLSPGPGDQDDSGNTPPVAYAKVVSRFIQKPPKTKLTDEMIEKIQDQGSEIPNPIEENDEIPKEKIPKEKMEQIKQQIKKSSQIVGIKPITNFNIHQETTKIITSGQYDKKTEHEKIKTAAVKNAIFRFLKEELKMDQKSRNSLKINKNFPSQNETSGIYYLECEDQDEVAKITSRAVNIDNDNSQRDEPGIVPHIPKILYTRYQALEKLAYHIRMTEKGKIQTNIRLAKTDYLMRVKYKEDKTPWKMVNPIEIPEYIPKPELDLLKDDKTNKQQIQTDNNKIQTNTDNTPPRKNLWDHYTQQINTQNNDKQINTQGTMSEYLQPPKHNLSPTEQTTENKKKKIIPDEMDDNDEHTEYEDKITKNNQNNTLNNMDNTPQRTESINKIISNLPTGVTMTQTNQGQTNQHHG